MSKIWRCSKYENVQLFLIIKRCLSMYLTKAFHQINVWKYITLYEWSQFCINAERQSKLIVYWNNHPQSRRSILGGAFRCVYTINSSASNWLSIRTGYAVCSSGVLTHSPRNLAQFSTSQRTYSSTADSPARFCPAEWMIKASRVTFIRYASMHARGRYSHTGIRGCSMPTALFKNSVR